MSILFPLLVFILIWIHFQLNHRSWQESFLKASVLWCLYLVSLTEMLSLFHQLSFYPLLIGWVLALAVSVWCLLPVIQQVRIPRLISPLAGWPMLDKMIVVMIVVVALLKLISALMSAPNTADAVTYHINRVEHWIQNKSIAHYPTHVLRQLFSPPGAEYIILNLRILSGGDHFSNFVQWFASVGSWMGVAFLARGLGATRRGELLAVAFAACLPMGLVQSTSTQNDYVVTFWLVTAICLSVVVWQKNTWWHCFLAAAAYGLALLTKGTASIYAPWWLLAFLIAIRIQSNRHFLRFLVMVILIVGILLTPFALRNIQSFKSVFWSQENLTNENHALTDVASNVIGNASLHLMSPWPAVNDLTKKGLDSLSNTLHLDLSHPDHNKDGEPLYFTVASTGEDDTGNLLHTLLFLIVLATSLAYPPFRHQMRGLYIAIIILCWITFCFIVRYHFTNSRYHLPLFVLLCPWLGVIVGRWHKWIAGVIVLVFFWYSMPWLIKCNEHPLVGSRSIFKTTRTEQYFSERPVWVYPYVATAKVVESLNCHDIGLIDGENEWGYPWWVLFHEAYGSRFRLEDIGIVNKTATFNYPRGSFVPCAVIASNDERKVISVGNEIYVRAWYMELPGNLTSVFIKTSTL